MSGDAILEFCMSSSEMPCQGACFCSPANDLFAVSFVKQINLDQAQNQMCNGQETFCLFDCGH